MNLFEYANYAGITGALLVSLILLSASSCWYGKLRFKNIEEKGGQALETPKKNAMDIVLLVPAEPCIEPSNPSTNERCLQFGSMDYYPYNLVEYENNHAEKFKVFYDTTIAYRALKNTLNLPYFSLVAKGAVSPFGYRLRLDLIDRFVWKTYKESKPVNTLEIRVSSKEVRNWSSYVSGLTLFIIPGTVDYDYRVTGVYYDATGKPHSLESRSSAQMHVWANIVFTVWGYIYTRFKGEPETVGEHVKDLIHQANEFNK